MRRRTGELLALALLCATSAPARAADDVRVEASVDRTGRAQDEVLVLTLLVEGPATVKGERHATAPLRVKVRPAGAGARVPPPAARGSGGWRGWERDLSLAVEVDRREAYLGEQVTATVWLLSPVGVVAYEGYRPPPYEGFWAEELDAPQRLSFKMRQVGGVPLRAYLVQKLALFPTRAGAATLGPYQLDVAVRVGSGSPLDLSPAVRRVRRTSAPVTVRVKPLPAGAPRGFDGLNVGSWKLEARAADATVQAGQPVAVRLVASGEGNVRALAMPRLGVIAGAKRFEPSLSEEVRPRGDRLAGARTLETVLVPEGPGAVIVPPVEWPSFDPRTGRYETARTAELRIEVQPGPATPAAPGPDDAVAAALRPIRTDGPPGPRGPPPWSGRLFLALLAIPPLAFAGLAGWDRARGRARAGAAARRARDAARVARRALRLARHRADAGDRPAFLSGVERALTGFAADRLGRPAGGMTRDALSAALAARGERGPGIAALAAALDACDEARFGGGGPEDGELLALAERALAALEDAT